MLKPTITPANCYNDSVLVTRNGHDSKTDQSVKKLWLLRNVFACLLSNPAPRIRVAVSRLNMNDGKQPTRMLPCHSYQERSSTGSSITTTVTHLNIV